MPKVDELCPCCDQEVKLEPKMHILQSCPKCGAPIRACSLCDCDIVDCSRCQKKYARYTPTLGEIVEPKKWDAKTDKIKKAIKKHLLHKKAYEGRFEAIKEFLVDDPFFARGEDIDITRIRIDEKLKEMSLVDIYSYYTEHCI